jgi:hypothetical protein
VVGMANASKKHEDEPEEEKKKVIKDEVPG